MTDQECNCNKTLGFPVTCLACERLRKAREALDEMVKENQEMGLYDDPPVWGDYPYIPGMWGEDNNE